nr:MAG TPA: hypothetical protein [Caudoviricetes sp.]
MRTICKKLQNVLKTSATLKFTQKNYRAKKYSHRTFGDYFHILHFTFNVCRKSLK